METAPSPQETQNHTTQRLWRKFTEPSDAIQGAEERQYAQFVSAMLLSATLIVVMASIFRGVEGIDRIAFMISIMLLFTSYLLSRTQYVTAAVWLGVCALFVPVFASVFSITEFNYIRMGFNLSWLMIPILLISLILSVQGAVLACLIVMAYILSLPLLIDGLSYLDVIPGFSLNTTASVFVIIAAFMRQRHLNERKRFEKALQKSEERYRMLFESVPLGIALVATDDEQLLAHNVALEQMSGYPAETMHHLNMQSLCPNMEPLASLRENTDACENGIVIESEMSRVDGSPLLARYHFTPVTVDDTVTCLVVIENITEQVQVEQRRVELHLEQEKVRLLAEFLKNVSHEFRTPLTVINTNAYLLTKSGLTEPQAKQLTGIRDQSKYLQQLVEDMLTMSRLDNIAQLTTHPLDINHLLGELAALRESQVAARQMMIALSLADDLQPVYGDPDWLTQAFDNVLVNAIRYTPNGGTITISTFQDTAAVTIEISDTGMGITEEALPHIFDRFYRTDDARTMRGAGLGLSITQKIIAAHHGTIQVESQTGQGSTFRILLPTNQPSNATPPPNY